MVSRFIAVVLAGGLCVHAGRADTQTDIRPEPGGKPLLFVDGDDIIRVHPYLGNLVGDFVGKSDHGTFILSK